MNHVLVDRYSGWRFFAHYGGRFDIRFIYEQVKQHCDQYIFDFFLSGSTVISFTIALRAGDRTKSWTFSDSGRLMEDRLAVLTEAFDVEHKKLAFDPDSVEYNTNDCRGLYEVLEKFFGFHNITSETIASHAMKVFRSHYLKTSIPAPHPDVEEFTRLCYYGGRCEVYRWDKARVKLTDINSMYPWAMTHLVPTSYRCRSTHLPDDDTQGIGFYEADIEYPEVYAPALPYHLDKLYFPMGKFTARCTSMELRQAIMDGAGVRIRRGCLFDVDYLFSDYVSSMHTMKQEAKRTDNRAMELIAKKLLNTLYGKFGQRRKQISYALDPGTPFLYGDEGPKVYPLENCPGICYYYSDSSSSYIMPHIAAAITARARLRILEFIRAAGRVWYTDTDSVFTDRDMPTGDELGMLSFKGEHEFQAYGLKEYVFGQELALKGVPLTTTDDKTGQKTVDYSLGNKYLAGEEVRFTRMAGFMESLRIGASTLRYVDVRRQKHAVVEKRAREAATGTRPWLVTELQEQIFRN